jgi:hypothetical protein
MSPPSAFGRRQPAVAPPVPDGRSRPTPAPKPAAKRPAPVPAASDLGPQAEALRVQIAADRRAAPSAFDQWRRSQGGQRWLIWGVTLISVSPGLLSFILDAPLEVSIGLEIAALIGNVWLRRTRRRRLREIVAWEDPADAAR